jgi:hypothetical protein
MGAFGHVHREVGYGLLEYPCHMVHEGKAMVERSIQLAWENAPPDLKECIGLLADYWAVH